MKMLRITSFLLLSQTATAYTTPEPTQKVPLPGAKKVVVAAPAPDNTETTSSLQPPFVPWPQPVVKARGDYRDETFLEEHIGGPLYSKQNELPRLPVPSLQDTIDRFLPTALPLAENEQEKQSLLEACKDFPDQARFLQERILERKQEYHDSSWLQERWNKVGYLQCRDPVAVKVSYFLWVPDDATLPETPAKGIARAAAMLVAMAQSRKLICSGQMPPEGSQDQPMCSTGFRYLFHSCRIPHRDQDYYNVYDPSQCFKHCIVACRGRFFAVDFVDDSGDSLSLPVLEQRLQRCVDLASQEDTQPPPPLGWLTSFDRDSWADAREELLNVGGTSMQEALAKLESGAFVLNLDQDEPESFNDVAPIFWHGGESSGGNRWFDKSMQLVCTKNGRVAYLGEHSMLDAAPVISLLSRVLKMTYKRLIRKQDEDTMPERDVDPNEGVSDVFQECWTSLSLVDTATRLTSLAKKNHKELTSDHEIQVEQFEGYGKKFIKNSGFNPDAYVQMAIQLAAYRLFGKQVGTYEAALTRNFLHGRTETTRSVSPESKAFVQVMASSLSDDAESVAEKVELLREATLAHDEYNQKASNGQGVDRHFFGLSSMLRSGEDGPSLFSHPLFLRSKSWRLSTSFVTYAPGFGPVVDDGLGIGYRVDANSCFFTITSRKENNVVNEFRTQLDQALTEMGDLVKSAEEEKSSNS